MNQLITDEFVLHQPRLNLITQRNITQIVCATYLHYAVVQTVSQLEVVAHKKLSVPKLSLLMASLLAIVSAVRLIVAADNTAK